MNIPTGTEPVNPTEIDELLSLGDTAIRNEVKTPLRAGQSDEFKKLQAHLSAMACENDRAEYQAA